MKIICNPFDDIVPAANIDKLRHLPRRVRTCTAPFADRLETTEPVFGAAHPRTARPSAPRTSSRKRFSKHAEWVQSVAGDVCASLHSSNSADTASRA